MHPLKKKARGMMPTNYKKETHIFLIWPTGDIVLITGTS